MGAVHEVFLLLNRLSTVRKRLSIITRLRDSVTFFGISMKNLRRIFVGIHEIPVAGL